MAQAGQRKCLCCGLFFTPDHRNRRRQRYCAASACRRASHAASHAAWLARPRNVAHLRGPEPGRPGSTIRQVLTVPGERPRDRGSAELAELRAGLLEGLGVDRHRH